MAQIDKPAEDHTWHEVPDVKKMKGEFQDKYGSKVPFGKKEDAEKAAQDLTNVAQNQDGSVDPNKGADVAASKLTQNLSEEDEEKLKEKSRNARQRTKDYIDEKMPKERRDQTIWRLKKMVVEIQGHQDCRCSRSWNDGGKNKANKILDMQAIETMLRLAEIYGGHSKSVTNQSGGAVKGAHTDENLNSAEADLKVLLRIQQEVETYADRHQDVDRTLRQWYIP